MGDLTFSKVIALFIIFYLLYALFAPGTAKYCKNCGHAGSTEKKASGSFLVEIILWAIGVTCAAAGLVIIIIIPIVYSAIRIGNKKLLCEKCGSADLLPLDSQVAINMEKDRLQKESENTQPTTTCPFCAETIKAAAIVCKHCGKDIPAQS